MKVRRMFVACGCVTMLASSSARAQHDMDHASMSVSTAPTSPGQAAFGAISEIVRMLEADPKTDWSKVNIAALRLHLLDMDDVMMRATMRQRSVPGGAVIDVTGAGATAAAIRRVAVNQARMLDGGGMYSASTKPITGGVQVTVTAKQPDDSATVLRIRGLGFAGLFTEGDHHTRHHMALARGEAEPHGRP